MNKKIYLSPPHLSGSELKYIEDAFESNWIAPDGTNTIAFENLISNYTGRYTHTVNSGTSALHLALCVLDIKEDDIVFCQSLTFAASAFPIRYMQAIPVFIDSEPRTWNIDPNLLEEALDLYAKKGKIPKAIIITHIYGMPADMNLILDIAAKYDVPVIEDAAEAFGSIYYDKPCGGLADLSIYSFNGNKILTTSGGGALMSKNESFILRAKKISNQSKENASYYEHRQIGYNYRLSNICAGIGRGQFEILNKRVDRKREIFEIYKTYLSSIYDIGFQHEDEFTKSNRWLSVFLFEYEGSGRLIIEKLINQLAASNIESRHVWKPMHRQPVFTDFPSFINGVSDNLFETGICLPSGTAMSDSELEFVSSLLTKILQSKKKFA
jgi:dTDP-4-amino-4,6-dideoxygalactose transaminase